MAAQLNVFMGFFANFAFAFALFAVKLFATKPFDRKGRKECPKECRKERKRKTSVWPAQDGNAFGDSDTTISFPVAICSLISMWRLRKCERARSPQARTK